SNKTGPRGRKPPDSDLVRQQLKDGLSPAEGIDVFCRILGSARHQVIVSTRDLQPRLKQDDISAMLNSMANAELEPSSKSMHARPLLSQAYAAPRNGVEQKIADIWQKSLGIDQIGIHDDFFELGGDSLLAVQMIAKLREALQMDLSAQNLLNASTIASLAGFIEKTRPEPSEQRTVSPLVEIQAGDKLKPPLFLVHPVGGQVYFYRDLARHLGAEQPVYG
ncbi:MAG: polyketide synthase, partial [Gammaproteobacteria bacterium]|nr:polyketide synthase [Gammaproteobacteria bacterium]